MRIAVLGGIALVLFGLLLTRLWFVQVISGADYAAAAEDNRLRTIVVEAPRGNILDRNGEVIVGTKPAFNLVVHADELTGDRRREVLGRLAEAIGMPMRDLVHEVQRGDLTPSQPVIVVENVPLPLRQYLAERRSDFPGVSLVETFSRDYRHGDLAAHIVGYTGRIDAEEIDEYRGRGYLGNERVGKTGVERVYERVLRGTPGERQIEVNAAGEPTERGTVSQTPPRPGNDLMLTIDIDTQVALQQALRTQAELTGATGAAGVALDPATGEVLAMASYATFEPSAFAEGRSEDIQGYLTSDARPLLNRAIEGLYPVGSTFKIVTAIAGLQAGFVEQDDLVQSCGFVELYGQRFENYQETCHGVVDLGTALEVSSDVYFYLLGKASYEAGEDVLQQTARAFGFDAPTGIDLPGERGGVVPDAEWKAEHFRAIGLPGEAIYLPGDDINLSVGQGYLLASPLQLANAYATIATDGVVHTPTIGRRVLGPGDRVLQDLVAGRPTEELAASQEHIEAVQEGLYLAANGDNGTSAAVFGNLPEEVAVAGKTGTAENTLDGRVAQDHSLYAGYAPYDDPQIVVAIVIERAGTGASAAAPAVCQTMAAYLEFDGALCGTGGAIN